jgi:hypothetical protein
MKYYTTVHIQKDGRVNLGTCLHTTRTCPALRGRDNYEISGVVTKLLPHCLKCCVDSNKIIIK